MKRNTLFILAGLLYVSTAICFFFSGYNAIFLIPYTSAVIVHGFLVFSA